MSGSSDKRPALHSQYLSHYLRSKKGEGDIEYLPTLEILEEEYVGYILELTDFDLARAADILAITPNRLIGKIKRLDIRL
jgi:hypothetical protein